MFYLGQWCINRAPYRKTVSCTCRHFITHVGGQLYSVALTHRLFQPIYCCSISYRANYRDNLRKRSSIFYGTKIGRLPSFLVHCWYGWCFAGVMHIIVHTITVTNTTCIQTCIKRTPGRSRTITLWSSKAVGARAKLYAACICNQSHDDCCASVEIDHCQKQRILNRGRTQG